ncbi:MAG TPA: PAS domain S-box protein [Terriglobales bacterium]
MQHSGELRQPDQRQFTARSKLKRYSIESAIVISSYFIAGKLGQAATSIRSDNLGPVWPAFGVALALVIIYGSRIWPAIAIAAFLVAWASPVGLVTALGQACAATLAVIVGAYLLQTLANFQRSMARLRDAVALLIIGAFGSAFISASIGTLVLYATHVATYSGIGSSWLIYWFGDSTGVLLATPFILSISAFSQIRTPGRVFESVVLFLLVGASSFVIFSEIILFPFKLDFLAFALLPLVMWSAIRMGTAVTSFLIIVAASIATVETALGHGPFFGNHAFTNAILLDIFFAIISITGLMLSTAIAESHEIERVREESVRREASLEARLRLASIIEFSDDAIIGANIDGAIRDWNNGAQSLFGFTKAEILGANVSKLLAPKVSDDLSELFKHLPAMAPINRYDSVCQRKDGAGFDAAVRISPLFDHTGGINGCSIIVRDISFRKRQESLLRESETRFRRVADTAPVMIWMSDTDKLCTYFNERWLAFTGQTYDSQLGDGWASGVYGDDLPRCISTYRECFDRRETFRMEYRLRRNDGEYRWISDLGVPRFNLDGSFCGYIGSCIDVTEAKLAEQAMSNVNRGLIEVQEKERARIARELHDDITQQLALLVAEIQECQGNQDAGSHQSLLDSICTKIREISSDIQAISHDLHSSKLEHLGLVAAVRGFCREFARQQKLEIEFTYDELPESIPADVSLATFRILQEALRNALKHSGVRCFKVRLESANEQICLRIADSGIGFDAKNEKSHFGLGLISMRERARLLNGTLMVQSEPKNGTTIRVAMPLQLTSHE